MIIGPMSSGSPSTTERGHFGNATIEVGLSRTSTPLKSVAMAPGARRTASCRAAKRRFLAR